MTWLIFDSLPADQLVKYTALITLGGSNNCFCKSVSGGKTALWLVKVLDGVNLFSI